MPLPQRINSTNLALVVFFLVFFCLCRTLSALAHWAAIFGEVDYLALLSFPFVKLFQNNQLICFEMIATILSKLQKKKSTDFLEALFVFVVGWAVEGKTFTHRVLSTNMVLRSWTMLLLPLYMNGLLPLGLQRNKN